MASRPFGFALRQHGFYQVQALFVVEMQPTGDFGGAAMATEAKTLFVQGADASARAEYGAKSGDHPGGGTRAGLAGASISRLTWC
jgi:hypothetical protein